MGQRIGHSDAVQSERGTAHFVTTLTEHRGGVPMQVTDLYFCRALHLDLRATAAHKDKREGQYDWGEHKEKKRWRARGPNLFHA